jgi:hypothetical protein
MARIIVSIVFLWIMALLGGCGGGDASDQGTGVLSVQVTDAKVDEALAVVLHYTEVTIHGESGNTVVDVTDPLTGDPGRSINLLDYTNGTSVVLFEQELLAGNYSWMRLTVDFDPAKSYIELADGRHPLRCTSCQNNGMKLNRSFTIGADQTTAFTLDYDLRSSITYASGEHHIRPTIRVVATEASGAIAGSVNPTLMTGTVCAVYVFSGADAQVDDIYIPMSGPVPETQNNPVTTAVVDPDTLTYTAAFLTAGTYTVSLTCDAADDDPAQDDVLTFTGTTNAPVTAGAVTEVNFGGG